MGEGTAKTKVREDQDRKIVDVRIDRNKVKNRRRKGETVKTEQEGDKSATFPFMLAEREHTEAKLN